MGTVMTLVAAAFFVAVIVVGTITDNTWKNVGISWGLLAFGCAFFGIALTL